MSDVVARDVSLTLIVDTPAPGAWNMRRDEDLLAGCALGSTGGAIRLYRFAPPCLSLGRMQSFDDVDMQACARDGVDVVRRPSGGRAVLHDQELTYAVVCRTADSDFGGGVLESCASIHRAVAAGLALLGVETSAREASADQPTDARAGAAIADCFARPAAHELLDVRGRKLVGSAQARRGGALLQHGSVLLDPPRAARYLREAPAGGAAGGVRELLGRVVGAEEMRDALIEGFRACLGERLR